MILLDVEIQMDKQFLSGVVWSMSGIIISLLGLVGVAARAFYQGMMKRFDRIDARLDPMIVEMAVHTEQIKEIRTEQIEQDKWLRNHDGRIQTLEHKVINS